MRTILRHLLFVVMALTVVLPGSVRGSEINTGLRGTVAIKGYDPVAYFTERRAVRGELTISYNWLGAVWRFSNENHKRLFSDNPVKFAPQYGGHCADGVALGVIVTDIDPEAWRIIDGKLYLNADEAAATDLEETEGQLERSKANWPRLRATLLKKSE